MRYPKWYCNIDLHKFGRYKANHIPLIIFYQKISDMVVDGNFFYNVGVGHMAALHSGSTSKASSYMS